MIGILYDLLLVWIQTKYMVKEKADPIEVRLNAIIRLLSEVLISQNNISNGIVFQSLNQAGMGPTEIAKLFGKSKGDVGNQITVAKNQKSKSKKNDKHE